MSSGFEPIPIPYIDSAPPGSMDSKALIKEAFRQGWLASRHWPNHPLPDHLFVSISAADSESMTLRIEWPS